MGTGESVGRILISLEGNEDNYIHHDYVVEMSGEETGKGDVKIRAS